jgi:hypothetical protein
MKRKVQSESAIVESWIVGLMHAHSLERVERRGTLC